MEFKQYSLPLKNATSKKNISKLNKTHIALFSAVVLVAMFGVLMVYSASFYYAQRTYKNQFFFLTKQLVGFILGLIGLIIFSKVDYKKLKKFALPAFVVSLVLLALVFTPLGVENYGAKRWISLPGFTIQPSEIAKFAFVLFASSYMAKNYAKIKTLAGILPVLICGGLTCGLIILEPNMSITICVGLVMFFMLFVGGLSKKHFFMLLVPALLFVPALVIAEPYRLQRLVAFVNPWANPKGEGYQLIQSLFSVGSGGIFGVGLFNSRQKYLFLPFSESDFIFSIIVEEFGFFGALLLLVAYLVIIICGIKVALNAKDRFGCYLASGITAIIAIQTFLNIAVVTGLVPPTGLPLPFISAGSTSLVVFMSAIGVVLNISKQSKI